MKMLIIKTKSFGTKSYKGQRQVICDILAKSAEPMSEEKLIAKVEATGLYNGKGTKGNVNKWAQEKAGGIPGSVRYHLRHLEADGFITRRLEDAKPKKEKKPKAAKAEAPAAEPVAEPVAA